jgi:outer membrane protein OmpA-like peptidoglycan-associated protein
MNMKKYIIIISFLLSGSIFQSCVSHKNFLKEGDDQFKMGSYDKAVIAYGKSYYEEPSKEKAQKIAKSYEIMKDYETSKNWWEKVIAYGDATPDDYYNYLTVLNQTGEISLKKIDSLQSVSNLDLNIFSGNPSFTKPAKLNFSQLEALSFNQDKNSATPTDENTSAYVSGQTSTSGNASQFEKIDVEVRLSSTNYSHEDLQSLQVFDPNGNQIQAITIDDQILKFKANVFGTYLILKDRSFPLSVTLTEEHVGKNSGKVFTAEFKSLESAPVLEEVIYFDPNKAEIRAAERIVLNRISDYMNRFPFLNLAIQVPNETRLKFENGASLEEKRAQSIASYFQKFGVSSNTVSKPVTFSGNSQDVKEIQGVFYTVQLIAGSEKVLSILKSDDETYNFEKVSDNLYRVSKGRFTSAKEANNFAIKMAAEGYADAFPVGYYKGERYTLGNLSRLLNKESLVLSSFSQNEKTASNLISTNRISIQKGDFKLLDCEPGVDCDNAKRMQSGLPIQFYLNQNFDLNSLSFEDLVNSSSSEDDFFRTVRRSIVNKQP